VNIDYTDISGCRWFPMRTFVTFQLEMSKKSIPMMITKEQFHGLHQRHGFTQAQAGVAEMVNEALVDVLTKVVKQGVLQAEQDRHTGLNGSHAKKAIVMTSEIPSGLYGVQ